MRGKIYRMELKFDQKNPKYEYVVDMEQAAKVLDILEKTKVVGIDVECTSLDPYSSTLLTVQIGTEDTSYIFDARKLDLKNFQRFKDFLENTAILKIFQNGKFDYKQIKINIGASVTNMYDTMLAEVVLNSGIGKAYYSLKELSRKYLQLDLKKDVRGTFEGVTQNKSLTEDQLKYSALDTLVMFPIFDQQLEALKKENLINIAKLEFAATRVVGEMELAGIYINEAKWRDIMKGLSEKRNILAKQFQDAIRPYYSQNMVDLFGNQSDVINMNSQQQLMDLLNNRLYLNLPSTGDPILQAVDHPIVKLLREYRGYEKLLSAFGESLLAKINPKTHRLHPEFNQLGTATGRFSCNNPNLQQIPRNSEEAPFRECINPAPGYKLVTADYSSFEMRILAELSGDKKMIDALNQGLDIHSYTASLMFNVPYSDDFKKKYPELRQIAKPIGFGLMYGMGPVGLALRIATETGKQVTKEQGEDYINKYFSSYPSVKDFLNRIAREAVQKGYSLTPAGRKRWYQKPEKNDPEYRKKASRIEREAKNHPIQGTNADAIKYALVNLYERFKTEGIDGHLTHTVHDEIVSEVREDQAEAWAAIQSEEMVKAAQLFIKKVSVRSDPFVGDVWEH